MLHVDVTIFRVNIFILHADILDRKITCTQWAKLANSYKLMHLRTEDMMSHQQILQFCFYNVLCMSDQLVKKYKDV